jgi:hypothetical protein
MAPCVATRCCYHGKLPRVVAQTIAEANYIQGSFDMLVTLTLSLVNSSIDFPDLMVIIVNSLPAPTG